MVHEVNRGLATLGLNYYCKIVFKTPTLFAFKFKTLFLLEQQTLNMFLLKTINDIISANHVVWTTISVERHFFSILLFDDPYAYGSAPKPR